MLKKIWTLWAKSLGDKAGNNNKDANTIAIFRSIIVLVSFITCCVIVANVIHTW
tara:strand:- start:532 stop:693 length:162 start_codon:yes stop_codon:yes gene_type:complete